MAEAPKYQVPGVDRGEVEKSVRGENVRLYETFSALVRDLKSRVGTSRPQVETETHTIQVETRHNHVGASADPAKSMLEERDVEEVTLTIWNRKTGKPLRVVMTDDPQASEDERRTLRTIVGGEDAGSLGPTTVEAGQREVPVATVRKAISILEEWAEGSYSAVGGARPRLLELLSEV